MNQASLLLVMATLFWGGNFVIGKSLVSVMPPVAMAVIRWGVSILIFFPFAWREWKQSRGILRTHRKTVWYLSITGIAGFNTLAYLAMNYTSSINASLMNSVCPILVLILSIFWLREIPRVIQLAGIILSCGGVFWIIIDGRMERLVSFAFNIGDFIMLAAVLSWAFYTLIMKTKGSVLPPRATFLVSMFNGWLILLPFAIWEGWGWSDFLQLQPTHYFQLMYISIFPSILAFMCWNKAVLMAGPARASVYLNLIVVFAAIFAVLFLGEQLKTSQVIGGIFVILGVYLSTQLPGSIKAKEGKSSYLTEGEKCS